MKDAGVIAEINCVVAEQTSKSLQHGGGDRTEDRNAERDEEQQHDVCAGREFSKEGKFGLRCWPGTSAQSSKTATSECTVLGQDRQDNER